MISRICEWDPVGAFLRFIDLVNQLLDSDGTTVRHSVQVEWHFLSRSGVCTQPLLFYGGFFLSTWQRTDYECYKSLAISLPRSFQRCGSYRHMVLSKFSRRRQHPNKHLCNLPYGLTTCRWITPFDSHSLPPFPSLSLFQDSPSRTLRFRNSTNSLDVLDALIQSPCNTLTRASFCLAPLCSFKTFEGRSGFEGCQRSERESVYDTELMRILFN